MTKNTVFQRIPLWKISERQKIIVFFQSGAPIRKWPKTTVFKGAPLWKISENHKKHCFFKGVPYEKSLQKTRLNHSWYQKCNATLRFFEFAGKCNEVVLFVRLDMTRRIFVSISMRFWGIFQFKDAFFVFSDFTVQRFRIFKILPHFFVFFSEMSVALLSSSYSFLKKTENHCFSNRYP